MIIKNFTKQISLKVQIQLPDWFVGEAKTLERITILGLMFDLFTIYPLIKFTQFASNENRSGKSKIGERVKTGAADPDGVENRGSGSDLREKKCFRSRPSEKKLDPDPTLLLFSSIIKVDINDISRP